jgi:hypothetical protein
VQSSTASSTAAASAVIWSSFRRRGTTATHAISPRAPISTTRLTHVIPS